MSYLFTEAFVTINCVDVLTLRNNNKLAEKRRRKIIMQVRIGVFVLALAGSTLSCSRRRLRLKFNPTMSFVWAPLLCCSCLGSDRKLPCTSASPTTTPDSIPPFDRELSRFLLTENL